MVKFFPKLITDGNQAQVQEAQITLSRINQNNINLGTLFLNYEYQRENLKRSSQSGAGWYQYIADKDNNCIGLIARNLASNKRVK